MSLANLAVLVTAIVGAGGLGGLIVALLKVRPEAGQIVVTAAQGAVIVQEKTLERLDHDMDDLRARMKDIEEELEKCEQGRDKDHRQIQRLIDQNHTLDRERRAALETVVELETEINGGDGGESKP